MITVIFTCEIVTAILFKVSGVFAAVGLLDSTLPAFEFPLVPLIGAVVSATASIVAAVTGIVTIAVSQLVGFKF